MTGWNFSPEVLRKAKRYVKNGKVSQTEYEGVYRVQGSARQPYTVRTDADRAKRTASWISCSCPHGANQGAGSAYCSHAVAVLLVVKDGLAVPVRRIG